MRVARARFLKTGGAAAAALAFGRPRFAAAADYELHQLNSRPYDLETQLKDLRDYITPVEAFFISSRFGAPLDLSPDTFRLKVDGEVDRPATFSLGDLRGMPKTSVVAVLQSPGNGRAFFRPQTPGVQWQVGAVGNARWTGVRVSDVLARAGVRPSAAHLGLGAADHAPVDAMPRFERSLPLEKALDRDTILAYEMNGQPLPLEHGGPLRLVVPDWSGENWVKWVVSLKPQAEETRGYWMDTAYHFPDDPGAPGEVVPLDATHRLVEMPVKSLITAPLDGELVSADLIPIAGVAFSGLGAIQNVEVSTDGGQSWAIATVSPRRERHDWQQWQAEALVVPGRQILTVRATDTAGNAQPATQLWNAGGYFWNVYHKVAIQVVP